MQRSDEAQRLVVGPGSRRMKRPPLAHRLESIFTPNVGLVDVVPPTPAAARRDLAVVLITRNSATRLPEWLDFHLAAGVGHFFVYENLSDDGTSDVLAPYVARGLATVLPWHVDVQDSRSGRWLSQQILAYAHAVQTFGGGWRHMAFIDDDEFLVPSGPDDLPTVLAKLGHPSNLSLPWHMFGTSGHETPPPGTVVENYVRRSVFSLDKAILYFKCIVDPTKVIRLGLHDFETTDLGSRTMNTLGRLVEGDARRSLDYLTSEGIQLNHYYSRSRAELQEKIDRGSANERGYELNRKRILWHAEAIERETVEDRTAIDFLARVGSAR